MSGAEIATFDVGTSALKGAVFDAAGKPLRYAEASVPLDTADRAERYEISADRWISALLQVARELRPARRGAPGCIVVSGNGPTLIPVSPSGEPLHPAVTWLDRRGIAEAAAAIKTADTAVDPSYFLSKALWFYLRKRRLYEKTGSFIGCPEYVNLYLTGNAAMILPTPTYQRYVWDDRAIEALGMERSRFPPFVGTGDTVGTLRPEAAEAMDFPTGMPVVAGGPDFVMSLLGTATVESGKTCDRGGSSEGINYCSPRRVEDRRLLCLPHIVEGFYNVSGVISTSGKAVAWAAGLFGNEGNGEWLDREIKAAPAGSRNLIFLPYLAGERSPIWDPWARGVFFGLSLSHGRAEMIRSVVESIGFAMRDVLEALGENGCTVEELVAAGGQARSAMLNQVKADITGRRILIPKVLHSELMGDACVGLAAMGRFSSPIEAAKACVAIRQELHPQKEHEALYQHLFSLYREIYQKLRVSFKKLGREAGAP
jgi:xylulokinase